MMRSSRWFVILLSLGISLAWAQSPLSGKSFDRLPASDRQLISVKVAGTKRYSDDAVLWGTLSPTVRTDRSALRDYFLTAFRVLPGLKVSFGDQLIRVYGSTAVNTGYYTFSYVKDGETKSLPARYSFTYVKSGENWLIVDHHSSAMPPPPK